MIYAALLCLLPTAIELWNDRHGDRKKLNDIIVLTLVSVVIAYGCDRLFDLTWFRSIALIFGYHVLFFDYLVSYILYRNKVIESPEARRWFSYMGKTSTWDKYVSRINPWLRLLIRVIVFGASVAIFIS